MHLQKIYAARYFLCFSILLLSWQSHVQAQHIPQLYRLRTELLTNPEGIDETHPRLSWEILSEARSVRQTAYQILVASSAEKLRNNQGDLWNSGKVASDQSVHISYKGTRLKSRMRCFWKVKVWTNQYETTWSEPASWSMGLLHYNDWEGRWIGLDRSFSWDHEGKFSQLSARHFRREFTTEDKKIDHAQVYIMGVGLYELYINGQKVGDQVLAPAPTDYTQSVLYNTFEVTDMLKTGENAVGTLLGNGRYYTMRQDYKPYKIKTFGYPKMLLQLEITFTDGSRQVITTSDQWKVNPDGPIRSNNEYDGEIYDARKEMPAWTTTGFEDSTWMDAEYVQEPRGTFKAQMNEPMKVVDSLNPVSINRLDSNTYILDMGQNMVGWLQMKVRGGNAGDTVSLRFAETLQENGALYVENLRDAKVTDLYIQKGREEVTWEPTFVYHGFRYVEIKGYPGTPLAKDFTGKVINDALQTTGTFETSNETLNQIYHNAYWGIRGNYKGMPVDCPQRNERQPWLGDRATGSHGESFIFGNAKLYRKWMQDIEEAQKADGAIPDVAPAFWRYYSDNITWPGTYLVIADMLYQQYGDRRVIEKHYPSMKKWLDYMGNNYLTDHILTKDKYGDWCVPPESQELIFSKDPSRKTDGALMATAYYYRLLELMQKFACLLDQPEEAAVFSARAKLVKEAFNHTFLNKETGQYGNNTVTANILPLSFGMTPPEQEQAVFQNIIERTLNEFDGHISTGVIGTRWLMRGLTHHGRADIAYQIATNRDYPSWGYMLEQGATTIWELWNGDTADPAMNSRNHVMLLGDLIIWFYEDLAGIRTDPENPGFKKILMEPEMIEGLDHVSASYHSVHGLIRSNWKKEKKKFRWQVSIPANTSAILHIPAQSAKHVRESAQTLEKAEGVRFLKMERGKAILEVGSGDYAFTSTF